MILVTQKKNKIKVGSLVTCNWTRFDQCLWTGKTGIVLREYSDQATHWSSIGLDDVFFIVTNSDVVDCLQDKNWLVRWFEVEHHPIQVFAENAMKVILE